VPRLFLAVFAISSLNAQLLVDTYAGGAIPSGVPAQNVALGTISGIAWDPSGNIVFCDTTYNAIRRVGPSGILETIAGTGVTGFAGDGGLATAALINSPSNPQYDPSGNLYFFDSLNYRIRRVDTNGVITTIAGDGQFFAAGLDTGGPAISRSLNSPVALAVDASGNVYIAEESANQIRRIDTSGNLEVIAQVNQPASLAVDGSGNIYVASDASPPATIFRISPSGLITTFVTFPPGSSGGFEGFATVFSTDPEGNVYIGFNGALFRYAPDGTSTVVPSPGGLSSPAAIDSQGNLALAAGIPLDVYGRISAIQTFTTQSVLTTVAGGNPQPAPDGTPLRSAWFLGPISIVFSHAGDLYIGESGACLIRKINAAGVLSTFAGTGICGYPAPSGTAATANLVFPNSIAVDSKDDIWVADDFLNLYSISQAGALSPVLATPVTGGKGQLAIDTKDRVYVLGDASLFRVLSGGVYQNIPVPSDGFGVHLLGIGADSSGNVYFGKNTPPTPDVYVVNDDASVTLKYPDLGGDAFAFDPVGNAWSSNELLTTSNSTGVSSIGLGTGFAGDGGPAQSALISAVGSIALGPDGNLYFGDGNVNSAGLFRIRRITGSAPSAPPVIAQNGIVNAASYTGGSVAPGELISIFGSNFGASGLQINSAVNNTIPRTIGRTKVLFNGGLSGLLVPGGAITAITANQINIFVPYEITPGTSVTIQVQVDSMLSTPVTVPVVATAPGLSTLDSSGSGQGAILNQDGTVNSSTNPAARGSIVSLYGSGLGVMAPQLLDGYLAISTPYSSPVNPIAVTIGGQPATILYAGDAPSLPTGVFQINVVIPTNISPGAAAVSVGTIGGTVTTQQVTVAVK
jgi:trimeric autotransporter adhesin